MTIERSQLGGGLLGSWFNVPYAYQTDQEQGVRAALARLSQLYTLRDLLAAGEFFFPARVALDCMSLPSLAGVINSRADSLFTWPHEIVPSDDSPAAVAIATAAREDMARIGVDVSGQTIGVEQLFRRLHIDGLMLGVSLAPVVPELRGARWIPRLRAGDSSALSWDGKALRYVVTDADGKRWPVDPAEYSPRWLTYEPFGDRAWLSSYVLASALVYLMERWGLGDLSGLSSEYGKPIKAAKAPPSASKEERQAKLEEISQELRGAVILLEAGEPGNEWGLELLEIKSTGELIERLIKITSAVKAQLWLGHSAAAGGGDGNTVYSEKNASEVRADKKAWDALAIASFLTHRWLPLWTRLNFGDAPSPSFKFIAPDRTVDAPGLAAAVGAILTLPADVQDRVDWERLLTGHGVPLKSLTTQTATRIRDPNA